MEKFTFNLFIQSIPLTILNLILGFLSGIFAGYYLFFTNGDFYKFILNTWFERIIFGAKLLNNDYALWFAINNSFALILAVVGGILLLIYMGRRRYIPSNRFASFEQYHPKITLTSLYMLPIGAVFINSFLIGLLLIYVYLSGGYEKLILGINALFPHGITEILALIFSSALGMTYIKILEPVILKRKWNYAIKLGKELVLSKTSLYIIFSIIILILFSAYLEGIKFSLLT